MSLESYVRALPKADLHIHLTGAIHPATLLTLAERNGIDLPGRTIAELQPWFVYTDFERFRRVHIAIASCLKTADDYDLVVYELGAGMADQNIRYAEVGFGATSAHFQGIDQQTYMNGLSRGRRRAVDDFGIEINWIFELGRGVVQNAATWDYATSAAIEGKSEHVIALGLSGPEYTHKTASFATWFDRARAVGLHSVPHAGELAGPASIWEAIGALGAERIQHGVRAIEDPDLVAYLAEHRVPLAVCPTSNICLNVYEHLTAHPLRRLYESGVQLSVSSDDPPMFDTTLSDELLTLVDAFDMAVEDIDEIVLNGVRHSLLPPDRKQVLELDFRREMAALKETHLGTPAFQEMA